MNNKSIIIVLFISFITYSQGLGLRSYSLNNNSKEINSEYFKERGYTQIKMSRFVFGQYLIPVKIRGIIYWFLLDTGSNGSAIKKVIADSLKLNKDKTLKAYESNVDESMVETYVCTAESLLIGDLIIDKLTLAADNKAFRNMIEAVNKLTTINKNQKIKISGGTHNNFDGILGDDFLTKYDAILDLPNYNLYLKQ
jgi:hypothetical protein